VAVRVPDHPVAQALIRAAGVPIAAPSANPSTRVSATRAEHVMRALGGRIELVLDGGPTPGGLESTVLDLSGATPRLLRPGLLACGELAAVLGKPVLAAATSAQPADGTSADVPQPRRSPGLLPRHYSPGVPLHCTVDDGHRLVRSLCERGVRVGWVPLESAERVELAGATVMPLPRDPAAYAQRLYAVLHSLEEAGVEHIVVALPPESEPWHAIRDRLLRAASKQTG
jgi:L-threonylcarbamoyladenylate synthase